MIRIVNWLLTRKCNLSCTYCGIVSNYYNKPEEYPDISYYHKNEMKTTDVLNALAKFQSHNPNCFHIFYGGEPLLRKDIVEIIKFCHRHLINYTIISNNTEEVLPIRDKLINAVGKLRGFTASVDPIFIRKVDKKNPYDDRLDKSLKGFSSLRGMRNYCDDLVAEMTVMKEDIPYLYDAVKKLSDEGINTDITFLDRAKTIYYDFSNITSDSQLVWPTSDVSHQLMKILGDDSLDVHMKEYLIPAIYKILPSFMDCEIEKSLHNVTIDADGSVRLCLRIRGTNTPENVKVSDLVDSDGNLNKVAHRIMIKDKKEYCQLCNHTCQLMSKGLEQENKDPYELIHSDKRGGHPNG